MDTDEIPDEQTLVEWQRTVSYLFVRCRDEGLLAVEDEDEERVDELIDFLEQLRAGQRDVNMTS